MRIRFKDTTSNKEEQVLGDVRMEATTECSVNCGKGNKTLIAVVCKGFEQKFQQPGKETLNYRIDNSSSCHTEYTTMECYGNECKGMST